MVRKALARWGRPAVKPEPQGPTDEEIDDQFFAHCYTDDFGNELMEIQQFRKGARTILARFNRPAIKAVPVAERPWERKGWCDADGKCWWGRPSEELCNSDWFLATRAEVEEFCDCFPPVVSLPHWELPVPTP